MHWVSRGLSTARREGESISRVRRHEGRFSSLHAPERLEDKVKDEAGRGYWPGKVGGRPRRVLDFMVLVILPVALFTEKLRVPHREIIRSRSQSASSQTVNWILRA